MVIGQRRRETEWGRDTFLLFRVSDDWTGSSLMSLHATIHFPSRRTSATINDFSGVFKEA